MNPLLVGNLRQVRTELMCVLSHMSTLRFRELEDASVALKSSILPSSLVEVGASLDDLRRAENSNGNKDCIFAQSIFSLHLSAVAFFLPSGRKADKSINNSSGRAECQ